MPCEQTYGRRSRLGQILCNTRRWLFGPDDRLGHCASWRKPFRHIGSCEASNKAKRLGGECCNRFSASNEACGDLLGNVECLLGKRRRRLVEVIDRRNGSLGSTTDFLPP